MDDEFWQVGVILNLQLDRLRAEARRLEGDAAYGRIMEKAAARGRTETHECIGLLLFHGTRSFDASPPVLRVQISAAEATPGVDFEMPPDGRLPAEGAAWWHIVLTMAVKPDRLMALGKACAGDLWDDMVAEARALTNGTAAEMDAAFVAIFGRTFRAMEDRPIAGAMRFTIEQVDAMQPEPSVH